MNNAELLAPSELVKIYEEQLGMDIEPIFLPDSVEYNNLSMTVQKAAYFLSQLQQWVLEKYGYFCVVSPAYIKDNDKFQYDWEIHRADMFSLESENYFDVPSLALLDALKRVPELVKGEKP